jgi:hypothetical protein
MTSIDTNQVDLNLSDDGDFLTTHFDELKYFPSNLKTYEDIHRFSLEENDLFWSVLARRRLQWFEDFKEVKSGSFSDENFRLKWFIGGKLNVSGNLLHIL